MMIKRFEADVPFLNAASVHNGVAYISGQVALENEGKNLETQSKEIFNYLDDLLEKTGSSKQNILMAHVWLTNVEKDAAEFNKYWMEWLEGCEKPARACVEAKFVSPNWYVEVALVAAVTKA